MEHDYCLISCCSEFLNAAILRLLREIAMQEKTASAIVVPTDEENEFSQGKYNSFKRLYILVRFTAARNVRHLEPEIAAPWLNVQHFPCDQSFPALIAITVADVHSAQPSLQPVETLVPLRWNRNRY